MPTPDASDRPTSPTSSSKKRRRNAEDCTRRRTRAKLGAIAASTASESSVSDESALIATSVSNGSTDASDIDTDSDNSSEVSESSEEPSSEGSSEDSDAESDSDIETNDEGQIVNLRANRGTKPKIKLTKEELGSDIRPWLKDFLPQLKAANEQLEIEREAGTLKDKEIEREHDGAGDGQFIEMNLGLGVLEQRDPNANYSSEIDGENGTEGVMGKLMGREIKKDTGIQEVGGVNDT